VTQAQAVFGEGNVTDQLAVGETGPADAATIAKFGPLLKQVATPKDKVTIGWADGKIVLQGVVASAADKTAAGASAAAIVGADNVENQLTIGSPAETTAAPETTSAPVTTTAPATTSAPVSTVATETTVASEPVTTVDAAVAAPTADITEILKVNNIEFETGSAVLTPAGRATVAKVAEVLKKYPEVKVAIEGHTDNVGNDGSNLTLSKARAATTKLTLEGDGVSADRMTADGFGETRPIADNATADGRARNRRTEFRLSQ
jgi:OmpA-OmpF porin, OOP family